VVVASSDGAYGFVKSGWSKTLSLTIQNRSPSYGSCVGVSHGAIQRSSDHDRGYQLEIFPHVTLGLHQSA